MNGFAYFTTLLLVFIQTCTAGKVSLHSVLGYNQGPAEFWTCQTAVNKLTFKYTALMLGTYSKSYDKICGYPPAVGTILMCSAEIAYDNSTNYHNRIFKYAAKACDKYSSYHYDWTWYQEQYENATEYYVPVTKLNTSKAIYSPTIPAFTTSLILEYKGYRAYYFNVDAGTWFSVGICGYFLLIILISAFHNLSRQTSISKQINNSKFSKLCQKYIIFPTLLPNGKFTQAYGWKYFSLLWPNRIQFLTDLFLFAFQVAFYCVDYRYKGTYWFGTPAHGWRRYLADRTGIMSFGKIPLLILFSGRNNFLLTVTGWSYSTFLHFHKVLAYWMFLDAMIHSVAYTINSLGNYVSYLKEDLYFSTGVAATVLAGVMLLQAIHPFRVLYYEYFLTIHVVFAIAFIAMCWYHCRILGWLEWLIAACAVWVLDRLLRVVRMAAFGYRTATITVVDKTLMKVEVTKPSWWFHSPGNYSYIYFAGWIFWENHPFTSVVEDDKICAYIRVKKGVTYRVWNKLVKNGNQMTCKVCLEGPYGGFGNTKLRKYDDALLLAGGSGAPGILENAASIINGKMVWVATTLQTVKAYQVLIQNINIDLDIYVTREHCPSKVCSLQDLFSGSESESESTEKETSSDKKCELAGGRCGKITINYCRPNLSEVINSYVRNSNSTNVGIMSCGPPVMSDEIRNIVANDVTSWDKSIDYFDEFQTW